MFTVLLNGSFCSLHLSLSRSLYATCVEEQSRLGRREGTFSLRQDHRGGQLQAGRKCGRAVPRQCPPYSQRFRSFQQHLREPALNGQFVFHSDDGVKMMIFFSIASQTNISLHWNLSNNWTVKKNDMILRKIFFDCVYNKRFSALKVWSTANYLKRHEDTLQDFVQLCLKQALLYIESFWNIWTC